MSRGRKAAISISLLAIVVIAIAGGGTYYRVSHPPGTKVRTARAARRDLVSLVTANGTIQAKTKVDLSANIVGQITQLNVEEGQAVKKGELLLVIDPARYGAAVDSRRAGVEMLEAELVRVREVAAQAKRDLERAEAQFKAEVLPAAEYERVKSIAAQADAALRTLDRQIAQGRAELAGAKDELSKTEIRAPMDGIVTRRNVERGEVVVTGTMNNAGTILMTISDMSVIEALLEVDQTDVPQLAPGQPASVLIDSFPDHAFPGTVSEIGSSPIQGQSAFGGAATGTDYKVRVMLTEHPAGVRPGLTVTADITTSTIAKALTIPIGCLVIRQAGENEKAAAPSRLESEEEASRPAAADEPATVASRERDVEGVYVLSAGQVEFRKLVTGIKGELDVEVKDGLEEGEELVVGPFKALRELKPGDAVIVDNSENATFE